MATGTGGRDERAQNKGGTQQGRPRSPATQTRRRAPGGVPPLDAFDSLPRHGAPGLASTQQRPAAKPPAGGKATKAKSKKAAKSGAQKAGAKGGKGRAPQAAARAGTAHGQQRAQASKSPAKPPRKKRPPKPVDPKKARRNKAIAAVIGVLVVIGVGIWLSLNLLFKIENYVLNGSAIYTEEQILATFGHEVGENMFGFDATQTARGMEQTLPYIENVRIRRRLPSTIVLDITPAVETFYVRHEGQYVILSDTRKVLEITETEPQGLTELRGLEELVLVPGQPLALTQAGQAQAAVAQDASAPAEDAPQSEAVSEPESSAPQPESTPDEAQSDGEGGEPTQEGEPETPEGQPGEGEENPEENQAGEGENPEADPDNPEGEEGEPSQPEPEPGPDPDPVSSGTPLEKLDALLELLEAIEQSGLEDITWISVADTLSLQFRWEGRITVNLGARSNLDDKFAMALVLLQDQSQSDITSTDKGTLDVSTYPTTLGAWFTPE